MSKHRTIDQSANVLYAPWIGLMMWNPFMVRVLDGSTQALGECNTVAAEWQDFIRRRLKEDVDLLERLTRSTTTDQILTAYAEFWRKAGEDYGNEITTITKLMTDITTKAAVTAQSATEEASSKLFQQKAA
jgi:Phasin protein